MQKKKDELMNIVDHLKDIDEKQKIFADPFISKHSNIIKYYLTNKTILDPIISKYTMQSDKAYKRLSPQIKECILFAKKQRDRTQCENILFTQSSPVQRYNGIVVYYLYIYIYILLGRLRSLSLFEKKNNYEPMELNLQSTKLKLLIRGKSCCCTVINLIIYDI